MAKLVGSKVVVVGGSSGIGLGVAKAALEKGADLVIVGRSQTKLQSAERTLAADGRVRTLAADMTRETEVARLFEEVGEFEHLVSTAGTPPPGDPIDYTDLEVVRSFVDDKLIGAVLVAKYAARTMKSSGSITFTSGINKDKPPVPGGAIVSAIAGSFSYMAVPSPWRWHRRASISSRPDGSTPRCSTNSSAKPSMATSRAWPPGCPRARSPRRRTWLQPTSTSWKATSRRARPSTSMVARA